MCKFEYPKPTEGYSERIMRMSKDIVDQKNYDTLFAILKNYDALLKEKNNEYQWPDDYAVWEVGISVS